MLAKVNGIFRIASEIELKYLPSGSALAKVNLVNSSKYKTKAGEAKEDTCFINGTVFGKSAEILNQYCNKGSKIFISGELKQDTWQDQNGQKRSAHNIKIDSFEFLDAKSQTDKGNYNQSPQQQYQQRPAPTVEVMPAIDVDDSEIPFNEV